MRSKAAEREAAERVAAVRAYRPDDAPTEQIEPVTGPAELAIRNGQGKTGPADATVASFVTRLANLAEHDRWSRIYTFEINTLVQVGVLLEQAERAIADRSHVEHALIRKLVTQVTSWANQVGALNDGGES